MCLIIVDVNVAPLVVLAPNHSNYGALHRAIFGKKRPNAIIAHGGHLAEEYRENRALSKVLAELDRTGRARVFADRDVDAETARIAEGGLVASDDHHILGLARVSGARVLCSADKDLRADFKKKELVDGPRGKLYSKGAHSKILSHNC